jgi:hypothetical protein
MHNERTPVGPHETNGSPFLVTWGRWLLGACIGGLVVGGATVRIAFPHLLGQGKIPPELLPLLIGLWSCGIAGLILLGVAWLRSPRAHRHLEMGLPLRPDGRFLSRPTKALACTFVTLFTLGVLGVWSESEKGLALPSKLLITYLVVAYAVAVWYFAWFYGNRKHHATTTYLNLFSGGIGFLLVPITWPFLLVTNLSLHREAEHSEDTLR